MFFKIWALVLISTTAVFCLPKNPLGEDDGWNELMHTGGIFHKEINHIKSRSNEMRVILAELEDLLEQPNILKTLYARYLFKFEKAARGDNGSAENLKSAFKKAAAHNLEARLGVHSWMRGINQFSDLSEEELYTKYAMNSKLLAEERKNLTEPPNPPGQGPPGFPYYEDDKLPINIDWRVTGKVTGVKNQGNCESCTHFATSAQLETLWAYYKSQHLVDLSPQYSQDCSEPGADHCKYGMWPDKVYNLLINYGSLPWSQYPYITGFQTCQAQSQSYKIKAKEYFKPWSGSEFDMLRGVANWGPMYVAINVCDALYNYHSGVLDWQCNADHGTHSVVVMGFGIENGKEYWLIKNSWGANYGEQGYVKLRRNTNQCNIQSYPRILTV